jgi:hypothetical protein
MTASAVGEVMDPQRDVFVERFAGKAWVTGDLDTESFMDAVVAIERLCEVRLAGPQIAEPRCAAVREASAVTTQCYRAGRLSGPLHVIDPADFDW